MTRCTVCSKRNTMMTCKYCQKNTCTYCLLPEVHGCEKLHELREAKRNSLDKKLTAGKTEAVKLEKI